MNLNNKGFTLVEVLAVIAIIAILGTIAIPGVLSVINTGKKSSYNIMISNIVTASQSLYEELEFGSILYNYDNNGKGEELEITDQEVTINLQTLVSNGFLKGTNNDNMEVNKNRKILLNPDTKVDIGECKILVRKIINNDDKTEYKVVSSPLETDSKCPGEYKKEVG